MSSEGIVNCDSVTYTRRLSTTEFTNDPSSEERLQIACFSQVPSCQSPGGSGAVPENVSEANGTREGLGKNSESVSLQRLEQDSVT
jgi:hypothetical protein